VARQVPPGAKGASVTKLQSMPRDPPPPALRYASRFRAALGKHARRALIEKRIRSIKRSNTVIHARLEHRDNPRAVHVATPLGSVHRYQQLTSNKAVLLASAPEGASPFSHRKFCTIKFMICISPIADHGRLLVFRTGNVIRAGKHTHGDAITSVPSFVVWANRQSGTVVWPATLSCPNTVCSCEYAGAMPEAVRQHWKASWSTRFPGISFTFPKAEGVTTELFLNKSNFIAPGVRSPEMLVDVAEGMAALHEGVCEKN